MVLLIGVLSCRTNRVDSYEMKVFNEIFDNLVEEMGALDRFEIPPPPIPFFDNNNPMAYDTVRYEQKITEIERENMKMKDTTFVIAVFDTLFTCDNLNLDVEYIGGDGQTESNITNRLGNPDKYDAFAINMVKTDNAASYTGILK
jgi:hypothetical protein